jgi:sarcosine oxidase
LRSVLYAPPPDSNVVIDVYPDNDRSIIVSPCFPGFKHSAPIGEALAEQILDSTSKVDISSFSLKSFRDLIQ